MENKPIQQNIAKDFDMRVYDRKRLVRYIGTMPQDVFARLIAAIIDAIKTTDPACAGSSGAEANVYKEEYTNQTGKSIDTKGGVDNEKNV